MSALGGLFDGCNPVEVSGSGGAGGTTCARSRINPTKKVILAVMHELDRPVSSGALQAIWDGTKPLAVFEYHLSTLVMAGVAELVVTKEELLFRLAPLSGERRDQEL